MTNDKSTYIQFLTAKLFVEWRSHHIQQQTINTNKNTVRNLKLGFKNNNTEQTALQFTK